MNTITLKIIGTGWHAIYHGPHAASVEKLFGTRCLPTPYSDEAWPEFVRNAIAKLNPDCLVEVR